MFRLIKNSLGLGRRDFERFDRLSYYKSLKATSTSIRPPSPYGRRSVAKGIAALFVGGTSYLTFRPTQLFNRSSMDLLAHYDLEESLPASGNVTFVRRPGLKPLAPQETSPDDALRQQDATPAELAEYADRETGIQGPDLPTALNELRLQESDKIAAAPKFELPLKPDNKPKQPKSFVRDKIPNSAKPRKKLAALERSSRVKKKKSSGGATKTITLYSVNTGDKVTATYMRNGSYVNSELKRLNWVMRDRRTGGIKSIDRKLYDLIYDLTVRLGVKGQTVNFFSGYRSAKTNRMLARRSGGVATGSYHLKGMAIDLFVPGVRLSSVHKRALSLNQGGVGYYPGSNFVHVDTGPLRNWPSRYRYIARKYQKSA